jgi:hypothetical protein
LRFRTYSVLFVALLACVSCAHAPAQRVVVSAPPSTAYKILDISKSEIWMTTTTTIDPQAVHRWNAALWFAAARARAKADSAAPRAAPRSPASTVPSVHSAEAPSPSLVSLEPCGGSDYPPCYVAERESKGHYDAYNPSGCGGSSCFGKWQFSGAWACHFGLSCDIAHWTPEQQDEAARALWNGGVGCANWDAC